MRRVSGPKHLCHNNETWPSKEAPRPVRKPSVTTRMSNLQGGPNTGIANEAGHFRPNDQLIVGQWPRNGLAWLVSRAGSAGHQVIFFEKDVPYYAAHRDLHEIPGGKLILYDDWQEVLAQAEQHLADADVGMVTSYCPDGLLATELVAARPCYERLLRSSTPR